MKFERGYDLSINTSGDETPGRGKTIQVKDNTQYRNKRVETGHEKILVGKEEGSESSEQRGSGTAFHLV